MPGVIVALLCRKYRNKPKTTTAYFFGRPINNDTDKKSNQLNIIEYYKRVSGFLDRDDVQWVILIVVIILVLIMFSIPFFIF